MKNTVSILASIAFLAALSSPAFAQGQSKFNAGFQQIDQTKVYYNPNAGSGTKTVVTGINRITGIVETKTVSTGGNNNNAPGMSYTPPANPSAMYTQTPQRTITLPGPQKRVVRPMIQYQPVQQPQGYYYQPGQNGSGSNNNGYTYNSSGAATYGGGK